MVQLPEKTEDLNFSNISELAKERIRRSIKKMSTQTINQNTLFKDVESNQDLGFKVFKYSSSNIKQWKSPKGENTEVIAPLFENMSEPLIAGWKKENLMSEILLLEGFPLTSNVEDLEDYLENVVYRVSAPGWCNHDLFVCLDESLQSVTVDVLKMEKGDIFICLDSALSDELKTRLQDQFNVHVI